MVFIVFLRAKRVRVKTPYSFECIKCGQCCRHYQLVELFDEDIQRLEAYRPQEFVVVKNGRAFLRHEKTCHFLEGDLCSVHDRKPAVCRAYPLSLSDAMNGKTTVCVECPGVGEGRHTFSFEENLHKPVALDKRRVVSWKLAKKVRKAGAKRIREGKAPIEAFGEIVWLVRNGGVYSAWAGIEKPKRGLAANLILNYLSSRFVDKVRFKVPSKGGVQRELEKKHIAEIVENSELPLSELPIYAEIMARSVRLMRQKGSRSALAAVRTNSLRIRPSVLGVMKRLVY